MFLCICLCCCALLQVPASASATARPSARLQLGTADSPPPARVSIATAVSSLAVNPTATPGGSSGSSPSGSHSKLPNLPAAAAAAAGAHSGSAAAAATAATAATAAMVVCLAGSSDGRAAAGSSGGGSSASPGDAASMLALQQAGSALISQLGSERRRLQEQLLECTQQHASAAAELVCVRQQLGQATAVAEQRAQQVRYGCSAGSCVAQQCLELQLQGRAAVCGLGRGGTRLNPKLVVWGSVLSTSVVPSIVCAILLTVCPGMARTVRTLTTEAHMWLVMWPPLPAAAAACRWRC